MQYPLYGQALRHFVRSLMLVAGLALWPGLVRAQAVENHLPVSEVVDGNTVTINKAGFYHESDFPQHWLGGSSEPERTGFLIGYTVQLPGLKPEQKLLSMPNEATVRLLSPYGERLYQRMTARSNTGGVEKWEDVAPYWDHVTADFAWPDPAAPAGADGRFATNLEFKGVPVPRTLDVPVQVNRLLATPNGTELYLEKVTLHKAEVGAAAHVLDITVSWDAAPDLPDTAVELSLEGMTDSHGEALQSSGSTSRQANIYTFPNEPLPAPGNKTFNFTLKVAETIPSLKQPKWFKRFRFDLKLPPPIVSPAAPAIAAPDAQSRLTATEADGVIGELESNFADANEFQGRLWLRPRGGLAPDSLGAWALKSITGHDGDGRDFKSGWESSANDHLFWKFDGRPALAGERDQSFLLYFLNNQKPVHLSVTAEVEPVRHLHQVFEFAAVPLPAPGQTKDVNQTVQAIGRAPAGIPASALTLRQITAFKSPGALIGLSAEQRAKLQMSGGLALVFEAPPALGAKARQEFALGLVADAQGRDVPRNRALDILPGNLLIQAAPAPHTWTVLLLLPSPTATTLRLQVNTDEILSTGPVRILSFKDVALPAPPVMYL